MNSPEDISPDFPEWPESWHGLEEDIPYGEGLLAVMRPFVAENLLPPYGLMCYEDSELPQIYSPALVWLRQGPCSFGLPMRSQIGLGADGMKPSNKRAKARKPIHETPWNQAHLTQEQYLMFMRSFYAAFPNVNALRSELTWTHYRLFRSILLLGRF